MSAADQSRPEQPQDPTEDPTTPVMSHPAARRRGRLVVPAAIVAVFVVIFLVILLVGHFA
jgi:hypothetical protein